MSAYVIVNFSALAAGQMIVTAHPVEGATLFMIAAILSALAIVPVALTRSAQPAPITIVRFQPRVLWQAAPVALAGSFMVGFRSARSGRWRRRRWSCAARMWRRSRPS